MEAGALLVLLDAQLGLDAGVDGLELGLELLNDGPMAFRQLQTVAQVVDVFRGDEEIIGLVDKAKPIRG